MPPNCRIFRSFPGTVTPRLKKTIFWSLRGTARQISEVDVGILLDWPWWTMTPGLWQSQMWLSQVWPLWPNTTTPIWQIQGHHHLATLHIQHHHRNVLWTLIKCMDFEFNFCRCEYNFVWIWITFIDFQLIFCWLWLNSYEFEWHSWTFSRIFANLNWIYGLSIEFLQIWIEFVRIWL